MFSGSKIFLAGTFGKVISASIGVYYWHLWIYFPYIFQDWFLENSHGPLFQREREEGISEKS
jgi:hypothetical protein